MSKAKHEIAVESRNEFGKNASRRARRNGLIPVNVYCTGKENRAYYVKANEWEVLRKQDFSLVYLLDGNEKIGAVLQEMQFNYMKNYVVHLDFHEVDLNRETHAFVKVVSVGEPNLGSEGVLEQIVHELEVIGKPTDIPDVIEVDVTGMALEENRTVKDVTLPDGVAAKLDADSVIFHVGKIAREEEAAAEGEGSAEPEVLTEKKRDAE